MPLLRQALAELGMTPVRDPQAVATDPLVTEGGQDLVIDGTEKGVNDPRTLSNSVRVTAARKRATPARMGC